MRDALSGLAEKIVVAEYRVKLPSEAQIKRGLETPQGDAPDTPWILHGFVGMC